LSPAQSVDLTGRATLFGYGYHYQVKVIEAGRRALAGVRPRGSLWRERPFVLFTVARTVSWTGSAVTIVALPMLLYQRTASASMTAMLTAAEAVPYLLFGMVAGAIADRCSRRSMMIAVSVLQALALASVPIAAAFGALGAVQLIVVALLTAAAAVFFDAASFAAVPELAGRARVATATSVSAGIHTVIGTVGPSLGGLVAASVGAANAMSVDAFTYLTAAALLSRLPLLRARRDRQPPGRSLRGEIGDGLRFLWRHPLIRPLTLLGVGNSLAAGAVVGLLLPMAVERLGLAADDARIGLFYAVTGGAGVAATGLLPLLSRMFPPGRIAIGGLLSGWVFLLCWVLAETIVPALLALGAWQASNIVVTMNGIVVRQQVTPDALQGRVNAIGRMIAWGGQPLGAALGAGLVTVWSVPVAVLAAGSALLAAGLLGLCTSLRHPARAARPARIAD
jgi:MFS family permease